MIKIILFILMPLLVSCADNSYKSNIYLATIHHEKILNTLIKKIQSSNPNDTDIDNFIIKAKLDINAKYINGSNLLHFAAQKGYLEAIKFLLSKGFDINSFNNDNNTPLDFAIMNGHLHIVEFLLNAGADINTKDKNGYNLLHTACSHGHLNLVKLFLDKGFDINSLNNNNNTPLIIASIKKHWDVAQFLIKNNALIDIINNFGETALMFAAAHGHLLTVKNLIEHNASISIKNVDGDDSLMVSIIKNNFNIAEYLLSIGADINTTNKNGWNLLHIACSYGYLKLVKLLLDKGLNINSLNNNNFTPLIIAAIDNSLPVVEFLISKGADINICDKNQNNVLMLAGIHGRLDILKFLIKETNLSIHTKNKYGMDTLGLSLINNRPQIASYLLTIGANINNSVGQNLLHQAVINGALDSVKFLVKEKIIDINALYVERGATCLMLACTLEKLNIAKFLVEDSADINKTDINNCKALSYACNKGHLNIATYIITESLKRNIDLISIPDNSGRYSFEYYPADKFTIEVQQELLDTIELELYDENKKHRIMLSQSLLNNFAAKTRDLFLLQQGFDLETDNQELNTELEKINSKVKAITGTKNKFNSIKSKIINIIDTCNVETLLLLKNISLFFSKKQILDLLINKIQDKNYDSTFIRILLSKIEYPLYKLLDNNNNNILYHSLKNYRHDLSIMLIAKHPELLTSLEEFLANNNDVANAFNHVFKLIYNRVKQ